MANHAVQQCQRYLQSTARVEEFLTDQLLLPMALARSETFCSTGLSRHAETHIELIGKFLDVGIETQREADGEVTVRVRVV